MYKIRQLEWIEIDGILTARSRTVDFKIDDIGAADRFVLSFRTVLTRNEWTPTGKFASVAFAKKEAQRIFELKTKEDLEVVKVPVGQTSKSDKFKLKDMDIDEDYVLHGLGELRRMDEECYVFAVTGSEDWRVIPKKLARFMLANCYTDGD